MIQTATVAPLWGSEIQPEPRSWRATSGEHLKSNMPSLVHDSNGYCCPSLGLGNTRYCYVLSSVYVCSVCSVYCCVVCSVYVCSVCSVCVCGVCSVHCVCVVCMCVVSIV